MKKTLRFSLLCCLLLAVILTASACLGTQTPEETTPQTTTQNVTTPEGTTPEETTPEGTTPEETTPEETTPEETTPEETTPEETTPETTTPEETTPEETTPEETTPEETTPETTTPEETTPEETTPEETTPEETTPEETTPEETTPEETTPEEIPDPDKPEGAVLVDSLNGKNAKELLEQFVEDFLSAQSYDCNVAMSTTVDGVKSLQFMKLQVYNGELAVRMEEDGVFSCVYFVDGTLYITADGKKIKRYANSVDEALGEGTLDALIDEFRMGLEFSNAELEAAANANIYLSNKRYIVTVHTFNEEEERNEKSMFYFNDVGELTDVACYFEGGFYMLSGSYNKPVTITPPADADEYTTLGNVAVPEGAVAVDSVNGMNATQLFEKFITEYSASTAYDIRISMKQTFGEETMTISMAVMLTSDAVYYAMAAEGSLVKIWVVDGTAYMFSDGEKIKQTGVSIEDIFGDGTFESLIDSVVTDIPDEYYTQLAEAQLYYYEGLYFYTITMFQAGTGMTTEIVFFDETGTVVRVVDTADGISVTQTINAYGNKPVVITPPEDADEYIDAGATPEAPELPETEDEIYELYTSICTTMQECESYTMDVWITDLYFSYKIAGEDKYLSFMDGESWIEQCIIDQIGYIRIDYGENIETSLNKEFLESFTSVEALLPINTLAKNDLQNLRCSYDEDWGEIVIEFEYAGEDNTLTQYRYAIQEDGSYIDITVTELVDGIEGDSYSFFFVEDPTLEIELPIGKG